MAQWEEKLGAILNDPQTMSRIMAIAQSLEGGQNEGSRSEADGDRDGQGDPAPVRAQGEAPAESAPGSLDLDPRLMEAGMRALSVYQGPDDSRTALLQALRPFLAPQRHGKLDKAVRITKLSRVVRAALDTFQGGEGDL